MLSRSPWRAHQNLHWNEIALKSPGASIITVSEIWMNKNSLTFFFFKAQHCVLRLFLQLKIFQIEWWSHLSGTRNNFFVCCCRYVHCNVATLYVINKHLLPIISLFYILYIISVIVLKNSWIHPALFPCRLGFYFTHFHVNWCYMVKIQCMPNKDNVV